MILVFGIIAVLLVIVMSKLLLPYQKHHRKCRGFEYSAYGMP